MEPIFPARFIVSPARNGQVGSYVVFDTYMSETLLNPMRQLNAQTQADRLNREVRDGMHGGVFGECRAA